MNERIRTLAIMAAILRAGETASDGSPLSDDEDIAIEAVRLLDAATSAAYPARKAKPLKLVVGDRVVDEDGDPGTVVEVSRNAKAKVKFDGGSRLSPLMDFADLRKAKT